jgi:hypothetical protein
MGARRLPFTLSSKAIAGTDAEEALLIGSVRSLLEDKTSMKPGWLKFLPKL